MPNSRALSNPPHTDDLGPSSGRRTPSIWEIGEVFDYVTGGVDPEYVPALLTGLDQAREMCRIEDWEQEQDDIFYLGFFRLSVDAASIRGGMDPDAGIPFCWARDKATTQAIVRDDRVWGAAARGFVTLGLIHGGDLTRAQRERWRNILDEEFDGDGFADESYYPLRAAAESVLAGLAIGPAEAGVCCPPPLGEPPPAPGNSGLLKMAEAIASPPPAEPPPPPPGEPWAALVTRRPAGPSSPGVPASAFDLLRPTPSPAPDAGVLLDSLAALGVGPAQLDRLGEALGDLRWCRELVQILEPLGHLMRQEDPQREQVEAAAAMLHDVDVQLDRLRDAIEACRTPAGGGEGMADAEAVGVALTETAARLGRLVETYRKLHQAVGPVSTLDPRDPMCLPALRAAATVFVKDAELDAALLDASRLLALRPDLDWLPAEPDAKVAADPELVPDETDRAILLALSGAAIEATAGVAAAAETPEQTTERLRAEVAARAGSEGYYFLSLYNRGAFLDDDPAAVGVPFYWVLKEPDAAYIADELTRFLEETDHAGLRVDVVPVGRLAPEVLGRWSALVGELPAQPAVWRELAWNADELFKDLRLSEWRGREARPPTTVIVSRRDADGAPALGEAEAGRAPRTLGDVQPAAAQTSKPLTTLGKAILIELSNAEVIMQQVKLQDAVGVSDKTCRKALATLVAAGLVERFPGREGVAVTKAGRVKIGKPIDATGD